MAELNDKDLENVNGGVIDGVNGYDDNNINTYGGICGDNTKGELGGVMPVIPGIGF